MAEARQRGHEVTLFNRGTRPVPCTGVESIVGDRRYNLARLEGGRWDAVLDSSGYLPGQVRSAATRVAACCGHYMFLSTLSVYADADTGTFDESAPLAEISPAELPLLETIEADGPVPASVYGQSYGGLKALCEAAVAESFSGRLLVVRAGLVIGPYDLSNRFAYWPARLAAGGEVLAPGDPDRRLQMIDVRDLAQWTLDRVECRQTGVFNVTGPPTTMEAVLEEGRSATGSSATLTWVPDELLLANEVRPWTELPLWIPASVDPGAPMRASIDAALACGLRPRSLAETVRDTLRWDRARPPWDCLGSFTRDRERDLLDAWHTSGPWSSRGGWDKG